MRFDRSLIALLAVVALSSPALAQDDGARKEAEARFQEGLALHDAGNDEQARLKFTQAYAMFPSPAILFNLARSEQLSNRAVDAVNHYRALLREPEHPKVTADMRAKARSTVVELTAVVAQLKIEARTGAKVSIDGKAIDSVLEDPIAVAPGKHSVEARSGAEVERLDVEASVGSTTPVHFRLDDAPGVSGGTASSAWSTGKTVTVIGLSAVAVGAVATSIGFFIGASNRADDVARLKEANPNCTGTATQGCRDLSDAADARVQDRTAAWIFLGTGIATGLGAVAAAFLWQSDHAEAPKQGLVPLLTPHDAGLTAFGHF